MDMINPVASSELFGVRIGRDSVTGIVFTLLVLLLSSATLAAERVTYFHSDALGSTIAASDAFGNLLWSQQYRPYGDRLGEALGHDRNTVWYTGKLVEDATGLYYYGARWYSPELARFNGIDPASAAPTKPHSFNRYAYGNNNPYRYVDPDGNIPVETFWDLGNVIYDIATGNWGDLALDLGAVVIPYVPAGISKLRHADEVVGATKNVAKEPNRIYSAGELKRRAENPRNNNSANPNHNFPESFNAEIFKGNKTIVSDKYHLYTKPGTLNGHSGTYEIGVRPSASGRTEVITHRFFNPDKK